MLKGFTKNGEARNILVTEDGKVKVEGGATSTSINNEDSSPVPVKVQDKETTLISNIQTLGTTAISIAINKKITSIDIANYSETANVTLTAGELQATIGSNIATTLPINKELENISLISTEADTKTQIVIKGVE